MDKQNSEVGWGVELVSYNNCVFIHKSAKCFMLGDNSDLGNIIYKRYLLDILWIICLLY